MLTPRELLDVQFETALRGYNRTQVDDFIRQLIGKYEELGRQYARLKEGGHCAQAEETKAAQEQVAQEEARLAAVRQETIAFQRRMRTLLKEFSSLLDQGEAETARLLELIGETLGEVAATNETE